MHNDFEPFTLPQLVEIWRAEHTGHVPFKCHCWYCNKANKLQNQLEELGVEKAQ